MRLGSLLFNLLVAAVLAHPVSASGPTVVPTAEGQIGEELGSGDLSLGARVESVRGDVGDLLMASLAVPGGTPPAPEFQFFTDRIHDEPNPQALFGVSATFSTVHQQGPTGSARSRNAADDGDFVAFSFTSDGASPGTMRVIVPFFDQDGNEMSRFEIDDLPTFPDPTINNTGVAVDNQGRATVAYTELSAGLPRVRAQRFDGFTGLPIGGALPLPDDIRGDADIALLDPAGDRLIIPTTDFVNIRGNFLDTTGPTVLPDFPISTTTATFANFNPAVASNPETGSFVVAWENLSDLPGDPVNIYARRFDADGNPIGDDFLVNSTTANAQGQPEVAMHPSGNEVIVWAGDASTAGDELDVFLQVYGPDGNPIGGEIKANTEGSGVQDRPAVRFLPEADGQGRPQFVVTWRDVGVADGSQPNGTGTSYKCFSIEGPVDTAIFADGFESGDTSSWSDTVE